MICREFTKLYAAAELPQAGWRRRLAARLHILVCDSCRDYVKQLRALTAYARKRWGPGSEDKAAVERLTRGILERFSRSGDSSR